MDALCLKISPQVKGFLQVRGKEVYAVYSGTTTGFSEKFGYVNAIENSVVADLRVCPCIFHMLLLQCLVSSE